MEQFQEQLNSIQTDLNLLRTFFENHFHDGNNSQKINLSDIFGLFEVVSTVPTIVPISPYDQIKIYVNGSTHQLYYYDGSWRVLSPSPSGATGTFKSGDATPKTITVTNGLITSIV